MALWFLKALQQMLFQKIPRPRRSLSTTHLRYTMHLPPNELYSAFSFIGFVLSVIPFYSHFKARNTGTCLFMTWTGLGCLMQCINSIVWNKNMIKRAPVYCDISTRIQVALNVAIPGSSLCINRQFYRVARMKSMGTTDSENRRILLIDLLIGVGIPVLHVISQYVVSTTRYVIFEDFGPNFSTALMLPTFFLFSAWPLTIGIVSFFYCVINVYTFYKRGSQCRQMMISGFNRNQYLRLIIISSVDAFATIPLSTLFIVTRAKLGIIPWKSWADTHRHYSAVEQIAGITWKSVPEVALGLEMFRWLLVACAFLFFALFGFTVEAREQYKSLYKLLTRYISTSLSTPDGAPHTTSSVPYVKRNGGVTGVTVPVRVMFQRGRDKDNSSVSFTLTDQPSVLSVSMGSIRNSHPTIVQDSHSDAMSFYTAKSFDEPEMHDECKSSPPAGIPLTAPPASVLRHSAGAS